MTRDEWRRLLDVECDAFTRLAYADWLEEGGDVDGAADQRELFGVHRRGDDYCFAIPYERVHFIKHLLPYLANPHTAASLQTGDVVIVRCPIREVVESLYLLALREHERRGVGEADSR